MPMTGMMGMMSAVSMALYAAIMLLVLAVLIVGLMVLLKVNRRLAEDSRDRARTRSAADAADSSGEAQQTTHSSLKYSPKNVSR